MERVTSRRISAKQNSWRGFLLGLVVVSLFTPAPAHSAEKYGNSLDWVPADVAFYASSMRWKEQIEIVGASKAWQKFRAIPSVAQVWQLAEGQLTDRQGPLGMALNLLDLPENQQLLQMLGDLFSNEIVIYGGPNTIDFVELMQGINAGQRLGPLIDLQGAAADPEERTRLKARGMLDVLKENPELIKAPDLVFAFKLVDTAAAKTQLKRLEVLSNMALNQTPLKGRLKREKVADFELLTFTLDGSLVPWDRVPFDEIEEEPGEYDAVQEKLEAMTLCIALGVRGDYLLLSIAETTAGLARLGTGEVLAGVKELVPLAKYKSQKLTGVGYTSEVFASRVQMSESDLDGLVESVGSLLDATGMEDEELKDSLAEDIEELGDDLKNYLPKPGASAGFDWLTDNGYEGYSYNWTEQPGLDGTKPLELVNHTGGKPHLGFCGAWQIRSRKLRPACQVD